MEARGRSGELRFGYQSAACVGAWSLLSTSATPPQFTITTVLTRVDSYWIEERPLTLDLYVGVRHWIWKEVEIDLGIDGRVTMRANGKPIVSE